MTERLVKNKIKINSFQDNPDKSIFLFDECFILEAFRELQKKWRTDIQRAKLNLIYIFYKYVKPSL